MFLLISISNKMNMSYLNIFITQLKHWIIFFRNRVKYINLVTNSNIKSTKYNVINCILKKEIQILWSFAFYCLKAKLAKLKNEHFPSVIPQRHAYGGTWTIAWSPGLLFSFLFLSALHIKCPVIWTHAGEKQWNSTRYFRPGDIWKVEKQTWRDPAVFCALFRPPGAGRGGGRLPVLKTECGWGEASCEKPGGFCAAVTTL